MTFLQKISRARTISLIGILSARLVLVLAIGAVAACAANFRTTGVAPAPTELPTPIIGMSIGKCQAQAASKIDGLRYIGCIGGTVVVLDAQHKVIATTILSMTGVRAIQRAGRNAIAVTGYTTGAVMRGVLSILRRGTLARIGSDHIDTTFLGVRGNRAYLDDWCCNGRPGVYEPATIYSVSLDDGSETKHVDLVPEPQFHPDTQQPLGQGEGNYMQGNYDLRNLHAAPLRMATSGARL